MMTFKQYRDWVANVACFAEGRDRLFLGPMGLSGEAGEVLELFKKHLIHEKPMSRERLVEELGDVLWYYALILADHNIDLEYVMSENIMKLVARHGMKYPDCG